LRVEEKGGRDKGKMEGGGEVRFIEHLENAACF
jgi:hypothetical protein